MLEAEKETPVDSPRDGSLKDGERTPVNVVETIKSDEEVDDGVYPPAKKLAIILFALYLAMFLVALDRTIISTAIPRITDEFNSLGDVGWYGSAYLLTSCAFQLFFGRIYTFYPTKVIFLTAIGFFEIGSALCGAAPNSICFIFGRAIAGLGSAGVFSGVIVIMVPIIPLAKRPIYQGLLGAIFGVSSVIGPLVGGAFTNNVSWRWCFYINLPIGAVSVFIILFILKVPVPEKAGTTLVAQIKALDPYGTAVFLPAIVCLILALQWGGTEYAWGNGRIVALLILFVLLFTSFIVIQIWQKDNATVPVRVLTQRSVACGVAFSSCVGGAMITFVYYMPIWFQAILGNSAYQSGINVLPFVLALVVGSIFAGALVTNLGYYTPFMILSSCVMAVGTGLITTFQVDTPSHTWIGYLIIFGMGMGFGMQQPSLAAQVCLSKKDVPIGASLMFFSQSLGGSIFLCVAQNVFTNKLASGLSDVAGLDAGEVVNMGATDLAGYVPPELLPAVLVAYNKALTTTFFVPVGITCASIVAGIFMEWKSVKGRKRGQIGKEEEPAASA